MTPGPDDEIEETPEKGPRVTGPLMSEAARRSLEVELPEASRLRRKQATEKLRETRKRAQSEEDRRRITDEVRAVTGIDPSKPLTLEDQRIIAEIAFFGGRVEARLPGDWHKVIVKDPSDPRTETTRYVHVTKDPDGNDRIDRRLTGREYVEWLEKNQEERKRIADFLTERSTEEFQALRDELLRGSDD